jgi:hypothetical protein
MRHDREIRAGGGSARRPRDIETELANLEVLGAEGLRMAWQEHHGSSPPAALPDRLLRLALAYDLQASSYGGLTPAQERRLTRIAAGPDPHDAARPRLMTIKPGSTLLRDWGGKSWRVEVSADGSFRFDGQRWRSLSAIASAITGTSRNGPAFFGLRGGASHGAA